jgi:hypothetical protein
VCYKTSRLVHTVKYFIFSCYFSFFISIHNQIFRLEYERNKINFRFVHLNKKKEIVLVFILLIWKFVCYKTSRLVHTVKYFIFSCYLSFFISIHNQIFKLKNTVGYFFIIIRKKNSIFSLFSFFLYYFSFFISICNQLFKLKNLAEYFLVTFPFLFRFTTKLLD